MSEIDDVWNSDCLARASEAARKLRYRIWMEGLPQSTVDLNRQFERLEPMYTNTTMLEAFEHHLTEATDALDEVEIHDLAPKCVVDVRLLERQMDRLLLETQDTIRRWKEGR